jgi:hypothetical protein
MKERDYVAVKNRVAERLLAIPGVHAVGVGDKLTAGRRTSETSIRVYVERKLPLDELAPEHRVPAEIEGVRTDVVERPVPVEEVVGIPRADPDRSDEHEYRPILAGIQVSRGASFGAGTLGCICDVTGDATNIIALTAFHVFYQPTDTANHEEVGQPNGQSSSSASCDDIFGRVLDAQYDQDVDVALVRLKGGTRYLVEMQDAGLIHGIGPAPAKNDPVTKRGRTTGLTGGIVDDISTDGDTNNPDGTVRRHYKRAIQIQASPDPAHPGPTDFTRAGDSGAAYLNAAGQVIAIHFSGSGGFSWGTPIDTIIKKFNGTPIAPGEPTLPAARHVALAVSSATAPNDVRTVPTAMAADAQPRPVITPGQAARLEEKLSALPGLGAWYASLYRRHAEEVAALVHRNRRVTVVWHRSGAAELVQWLVRAFSQPGVTVPERIQGRPVRACIAELAGALARSGSAALVADLAQALPTLPDVAGLTDGEILDRVRTA